MFCKRGVLRNFTKFNGKYLCQSLYFNKVASLRALGLQLYLKKSLWHRCFPVKFAKFLRTPFLTETLRWLLLRVSTSRILSVCPVFVLSRTPRIFLAKGNLRTPFLRNTPKWLISNNSYFFKKRKNRNNFLYLL